MLLYFEKQVFSQRSKKLVYLMLKYVESKFSHDTPETCIFDTLLRGKAGFLMTRQKRCIFDALLRVEAVF